MSQNPQNQRFLLCNITQYIPKQASFEPSKIMYTKQQRREISTKYIYIQLSTKKHLESIMPMISKMISWNMVQHRANVVENISNTPEWWT